MTCSEAPFPHAHPSALQPADLVVFGAPRGGADVPRPVGAQVGLVVAIHEARGVLVAAGKHDKVSRVGRLATEVVLEASPDLLCAGLRRPTRFDLREAAWLPATSLRGVGRFPTHNRSLMRDLHDALTDALRAIARDGANP